METSLLIIIIVESYLGNQTFPQISLIRYVEPQCASLTGTIIAQTSNNQTSNTRTVVFDCPGKTALRIFPLDSFTCPTCRDPQFFPVVPVFSLPQEYLTLSLTCQGDCFAGQNPAPLKSGQVIFLSSWWGYNYIAVVRNSPTKISSFAVTWRNGEYLPPSPPPPPPPFFELYASPVNITIPAGQAGSSTLFVTSLHRFNGTVGFWGAFTWSNMTGEPTFSFAPARVLLRAGGSNLTIVTVTTFSYTPRGRYVVSIFGQSDGDVNGTDINVSIT